MEQDVNIHLGTKLKFLSSNAKYKGGKEESRSEPILFPIPESALPESHGGGGDESISFGGMEFPVLDEGTRGRSERTFEKVMEDPSQLLKELNFNDNGGLDGSPMIQEHRQVSSNNNREELPSSFCGNSLIQEVNGSEDENPNQKKKKQAVKKGFLMDSPSADTKNESTPTSVVPTKNPNYRSIYPKSGSKEGGGSHQGGTLSKFMDRCKVVNMNGMSEEESQQLMKQHAMGEKKEPTNQPLQKVSQPPPKNDSLFSQTIASHLNPQTLNQTTPPQERSLLPKMDKETESLMNLLDPQVFNRSSQEESLDRQRSKLETAFGDLASALLPKNDTNIPNNNSNHESKDQSDPLSLSNNSTNINKITETLEESKEVAVKEEVEWQPKFTIKTKSSQKQIDISIPFSEFPTDFQFDEMEVDYLPHESCIKMEIFLDNGQTSHSTSIPLLLNSQNSLYNIKIKKSQQKELLKVILIEKED